MNKSLVFSVAGTPRPQPRPRFVKGRVVSTADPKAKLWRLAVERAVHTALSNRGERLPLFTGAVRVTMTFMFPTVDEKRLGTFHTHKPDADNIAKLCADLMETAGVFSNDSKAVDMRVTKMWARIGGVSIHVDDLSEERRATTSPAGEPPAWLIGPAPN